MNNPIFKAEACPFCGRAARFGMAVMRRGTLRERAFIGCKRCKVWRYFDSLIDAISWWNTRRHA